MKDRAYDFMKTMCTTSLSMLVAAVAFWLLEGRYYISVAEAQQMINTTSPYIKDKPLIDDFLQRSRDESHRHRETVKENTNAINSLKTEIAVLNQVLRDKNE